MPAQNPSPRPPAAPPRARSRDPVVDALRSAALARVVLWHATAATWLSWVFPAMPVMFFLAGSVLAGSVAAESVPAGSLGSRAALAAHARQLPRRLGRVLIPFWAYSLAVLSATAVGGSVLRPDGGSWPSYLLPLSQTTGTGRDWLTGHLWYLTDYLVLLLLLPLAVVLARRVRPVLAAALLGLVLLEIGPLVGLPAPTGAARVAAGDLLCYGLFAVLGIAWATRSAAAGGSGGPNPGPVGTGTTARTTAAGVALIAVSAGASLVVPLPTGSLNESYLLLTVAALGWLLLVASAQAPLRRLARSARVVATTRAVSARALTIYLWHPAAILLALAIAPGSIVAVLPLTVLFTAAAVIGLGWLEDVAARRTPQWWPHPGAGQRRSIMMPGRIALAATATLGIALVAGSVSWWAIDRTSAATAAMPRPSDRTALSDTAFAATARDAAQRSMAAQLPADRLQQSLEEWIAAQPEITDAVVSVAAGAEHWSGSAARGEGAPRAAETVVGIASMTKTFTASLAVQLADDGLIDLDAPVPDLTGVQPLPDGVTVTARQLLQHTTGLIQYTEAPGYDPGRHYTAAELVSLSTQAPRPHPPDAGVTYSNSNYLWLGLLLESVGAADYRTLLAERITGPLKLSTIELLDEDRTGWVGSASGGVRALPADVARFYDALLNRGEVVSVDALARMTDLTRHNGGLGIWPLCPCGQSPDGVKWATGLGHYNGDGAAFAFPDDQLAVYVRIGESNPDAPLTADRMVQLRDELIMLIRAIATGIDHAHP